MMNDLEMILRKKMVEAKIKRINILIRDVKIAFVVATICALLITGWALTL